jgi:FkbM family methyltransferase
MQRVLESKSGAVVDVGANVGLFLLWLRTIEDERSYIGFEPNPDCYHYLQELIRRNGFQDTAIIPAALTDSRRRARFYAKRAGDKMGSLHSFSRGADATPRSFDLITDIGDTLIEQLHIDAVSFIKIDVEGTELEALRGLQHTIARFRPVILCEVIVLDSAHASCRDRKPLLDELLTLLPTLDYSMLSVDVDGTVIHVRSAADLKHSHAADRLLVHHDDLAAARDNWLRQKRQ